MTPNSWIQPKSGTKSGTDMIYLILTRHTILCIFWVPRSHKYKLFKIS